MKLPDVHPREEVDALGDEIAVAAATHDSATHRLLTAIRRFDALAGWAWQGAKSCAHWLSWRIGDGLGAAREKVRVARALGELPLIDEALRKGELSWAKTRAITRVCRPGMEERLLIYAKDTTGAQLEKICRGFRQVERRLETNRKSVAKDADRFVHRRHLASGMVRIEAQLTADEADLVFRALLEARARSHAKEKKASAPKKDAEPQSLANDLVLMAETMLATGPKARTAGHRNQIIVHLTPDTWSEPSSQNVSAETCAHHHEASAGTPQTGGRKTRHEPRAKADRNASAETCACADPPEASGTPRTSGRTTGEEPRPNDRNVSAETFQPWRATLADGTWLSGSTLLRMACDAGIVMAKVGANGEVLDVGRKRRTVPAALMRALRIRDGGCSFPGCTHQAFVEAHHVKHWAHGGKTNLENTMLLCSFHHQLIHDGLVQVERVYGSFMFMDADGEEIEESPPPMKPELLRNVSPPTPHFHRVDYPAAIQGLVQAAGLDR